MMGKYSRLQISLYSGLISFLLILTTLFLYMYAIGKRQCCTNFLHSFICSHYCHFFNGMRSGLFSRDIFRKAAIGENRRKIAKLGFR